MIGFPIDDNEKEEYIPRTRIVEDDDLVNFDIKKSEEIDKDPNNDRTIAQPRDLLYDCISRNIRRIKPTDTKSEMKINWLVVEFCLCLCLLVVGFCLHLCQ